MVFSLRQVKEKGIKHVNLYAVFTDLTKGFDTVNRELIWVTLKKFGCPQKFQQILLLFLDGMMGIILSSGDISTPFVITIGV